MPDHLHILVEGTSDDSDAKRLIKAFKQYSGSRIPSARVCQKRLSSIRLSDRSCVSWKIWSAVRPA